MAKEQKKRSTDDVLTDVAKQSYLKSYIQNPLGFSTTTGLAADTEAPFREGIAAGASQVKGDFTQFSALYDLIQGEDESAKAKLQNADQLYAQADEISQNFVQFENAFDSAGDFGEYAKLQLGKLVPQILSSVGAGLGSAVVYGLGKQTLKQGTKQYIKNKASRIVNKEKAGIVLNKAEKKFLQEGYEGQAYVKLLKDNQTSWNKFAIDNDAAKLTGKLFGTKVVGGVGLNAKTAFWAGSFGQSEVIGAAQSAQEYRDQDIELTKEEAALAIMYGVPQALLDTASEFVFFRGALKVAAGELKNAATQKGKQQAASVITDILKASATQAGKNALLEGATEMGQEGVLITQRLYDPLSGGKYADPTYDKEMIKMRVLESGFVGALAGGARGAGGGVIAKSYDLLANKEDNRNDIETEAARIREFGSPATEPMVNVSTQIDDMFDPDIPRNIVFMSGMSQQSLEAMGSTSSTLGVATLDIESLMKKYPSLGTFNSTNQNPGLFIFDENNPTSNSIMKTIQNGQKVTDEYLRDILGFSGTQNPNDNVVIVTRNKEGRVAKAESVGVDEDGNTTLIQKVQAKAEQDYPATKGYTVERVDKTDYQNELANAMQEETAPVQTEFDFGDAEQDPDIIKAKEEEAKLKVKDVTSVTRDGNRVRIETKGSASPTEAPGVKSITSLKDLGTLLNKEIKPQPNINRKFDLKQAKRAAYLAITQENKLVTRDKNRQPKSKPFTYTGKLEVAEKNDVFAYRGEFTLDEALAISKALEIEARLNVLQPIIGPEKTNGKREITFKIKGFNNFAMQAEKEGPRYNKDRLADLSTPESDEASGSAAADGSGTSLPSVANLENFEDVKGFLYARSLLQRNASSRALNASGKAVTRRAANAWQEGGNQFTTAGFFSPLSNMTQDQKERFTPSLELRRQLQGLLSTEVEGGLVESSKLKKVISGFNVNAEGNFAADIPSPVYQAIIDAHAANPDIELTVLKTDRQGEILNDVKIQNEEKLGKTPPPTFYRVVELLQNDKQETLLANLKSSFITARKIERPYKDTNLTGKALTSGYNRWNSSPYAEAFRLSLDPMETDTIIVNRNKKALNNANTKVVSMKQLLTGEAKRRLADTSLGTTGIITQSEYQSIIRLEDNKLVFDNFMSLLVSLKEGGFVLEYGEGYARKDEGGFDFTKPIPSNQRYKPVIEKKDAGLKAIVIPEFKNKDPLPPELVKNASNKAQTVGDLIPPEGPQRGGKLIPKFLSFPEDSESQRAGTESTLPNPNKKEQKSLSNSLTKISKLKNIFNTGIERFDDTAFLSTIEKLGLVDSDIAGFDLEFNKKKGLSASQKRAIDRSVIRGFLGLTSEEDTHRGYPFKDNKGGLDFLNALEEKLNEDFAILSLDFSLTKKIDRQKYLEAIKSPFITGENSGAMFRKREGPEFMGPTRPVFKSSSDFEVNLDAAIEVFSIVDQTLEASQEFQSQPAVMDDNLEMSYSDVVAMGEGVQETDMFAAATIINEIRKTTGERGAQINLQQGAFGVDTTGLSGPGRVDEKADTWKEYNSALKPGKTTFGPKIQEFMNLYNDEQLLNYEATPFGPVPVALTETRFKKAVEKPVKSFFSNLEALDLLMRNRFKNTRDVVVLSVDDKLPNLGTANVQVARIIADMRKNKEPAKYIGFNTNKDFIILNPYAYAKSSSPYSNTHILLRQTSLYYELAHEMGHSITEDQMTDLFKFGNKELRTEFNYAFERAKADLEAKGDFKYSDPNTGPQEFLADQIAGLALADVQMKPDNPLRNRIGLQNKKGIENYTFNEYIQNNSRLAKFLRKVFKNLQGFLKQVHVIYKNRFRLARNGNDLDVRFLSSLNRTLSTYRSKPNPKFKTQMVVLDAANVTFEDAKKYINKKQAKKLKNYLARQASKMYNAELGLTRVFGHPAEHWSMKYMFAPAASYLTNKSLELGKSMYGLTQSEDDFGYKRTYLLIQNQKMSDLLSILPTDEKGNPDFEALQTAAAVAEDYVAYPADTLDVKNPTQKVALEMRNWLNNFFGDYIQDPQNPNRIKFMQDFFPRLWSMGELRNTAKSREVLAGLLFEANKNKVDTVTNKKGEEVEVPHTVAIENYKTGKLVDYPAAKESTWELFVDKWLGTEDDSDIVLLEDDESSIDQNKKTENSDINNLSIGMTKSRAEYFVALKTGDIRKAEATNDVTLLTSPENALRRYVQDTVKKIEYNKQVQTAFRVEDYERMEKMYGNTEDIPFTKPKKRNIAEKGKTPVYTQEYPVYGARAAEVMLSRINDPAERQGARKAVEGLLGKSGAGMSPFMRQVNSWGLLLNWFGYLSFAVLASAPDMAGPLFRGKGLIGISDVVKEAVIPWTKDADFAKQFAIDIGVVSHDSITSMFIDAAELGYMNETTQKWAGIYFKGIGLDWYTNFTRKFAAGLGEQFLFRLATAKQTLETTRWLRELGLTADDVVYWHNQNGDKGRAKRDFSTPQGEKVRMAIAQFVEESILRPGASERPVWASNPYFALVFQLKSFFYAYGKTIIGGVYREALNSYSDKIAQGQKPSSALFGATAPVALGASALLVLTALGLEMRELIKYLANGGDSTKFRTNDMDWGEYMFEMTDRAGVFGPLGAVIPILEAPGYGDSMILEALGPMAGRVDDLLVQGNIALNPEDSFWSFVPIASGLELDWF